MQVPSKKSPEPAEIQALFTFFFLIARDHSSQNEIWTQILMRHPFFFFRCKFQIVLLKSDLFRLDDQNAEIRSTEKCLQRWC